MYITGPKVEVRPGLKVLIKSRKLRGEVVREEVGFVEVNVKEFGRNFTVDPEDLVALEAE